MGGTFRKKGHSLAGNEFAIFVAYDRWILTCDNGSPIKMYMTELDPLQSDWDGVVFDRSNYFSGSKCEKYVTKFDWSDMEGKSIQEWMSALNVNPWTKALELILTGKFCPVTWFKELNPAGSATDVTKKVVTT